MEAGVPHAVLVEAGLLTTLSPVDTWRTPASTRVLPPVFVMLTTWSVHGLLLP